MLTMEEARARVAKGAAHLDVVRPGWFDQIDIGTLTIRDPCRCIIGQLFNRGFAMGLAQLGLYNERCISHAFASPYLDDFTPLQDAWVELIVARRHPVTEEQPEAVLVTP